MFSLIRPPATFLLQPHVRPAALRPGDFAILGAGHGTPYPATTDVGYDTATGSGDGPAAIRAAINQSSTNIDHYDFDLDGPLLGDGRRRLCDCGDLALSAADGAANRVAIEAATAAILGAGAVPILLGGDDSVPIPYLAAFAEQGPVDVLQVDAHIDWRDSIGGERMGYSSTMRRASELSFVRSITQIGMRGVGSARMEEVAAARAWGARLITTMATQAMGAEALAESLPADGSVVIQVDLDAFDPSVCPAVNAPMPGGFGFAELAAILRAVALRRRVIGLSLVELVPARDPHGLSANVAGRLVCNTIGAICRSAT